MTAEDEMLLDEIERELERLPNPPASVGTSEQTSGAESRFLTECAVRRRRLEAFRRLRERAAC